MTMHNFHDDAHSDFTPLADQFSDRRKESPMPVILELLRQVHTSQKELDKKLSRHMSDETEELTQAVSRLMAEAFPAADPLGHRAYHEASIKRAEEQAKFWGEMRIAVGKWVGLGVLTFLAGAAWQTFLKGPK